ncbi:alanine racemase [Cellulomonas sp. ACRRI]|uniref:alanine racemase n=1 Tax=Cellulomonas sp. ACRRI TaxID=2918188 RepID=UPI001EF3005E|nr:alanine racemase [Cellulomonas sp. ACRRI]MCG7285792.1 alanine racemase [Cellulomonas sp. ACRRI]
MDSVTSSGPTSAPAVVGPWTKGLWQPEPVAADAWLSAGRHLLDGSFTWPLLTVDGGAVDHNVATMAAFAAEHGLLLAPHGKTSMAPGLFARQLAAGAWGMTVATGNQALAARSAGVRRLLLANQVLDDPVLRWLAGPGNADGEVVVQLDSAAGLARLADVADPARPVGVLLELGHAGGRTGLRHDDNVLDLATAARARAGVRLLGVTAYEGGLPGVPEVRSFLERLRDRAAALAGAGLIDADEVTVSVGGSAYFDVVAEVLGGRPVLGGLPARVLLRSGSTVTHDHGVYARRTPFTRVPGGLRPALRVWAQVTSCPEPGLAIVGAGKRDVPVDEGLPVPLRVHRAGAAPEPVAGWALTRTNDQHAYLEAAGPAPTPLSPGDLLELGVSHPCTAFDKWRVVPVVDADLRVTELLATLF